MFSQKCFEFLLVDKIVSSFLASKVFRSILCLVKFMLGICERSGPEQDQAKKTMTRSAWVCTNSWSAFISIAAPLNASNLVVVWGDVEKQFTPPSYHISHLVVCSFQPNQSAHIQHTQYIYIYIYNLYTLKNRVCMDICICICIYTCMSTYNSPLPWDNLEGWEGHRHQYPTWSHCSWGHKWCLSFAQSVFRLRAHLPNSNVIHGGFSNCGVGTTRDQTWGQGEEVES